VNKTGKYKQEKRSKNYRKQIEASDQRNKHTNNQHSAKIYNVSRVHTANIRGSECKSVPDECKSVPGGGGLGLGVC